MRATAPTTHTARKRFWCDWCSESIEPGETYTRYRWYDYGDVGTCRMHPECYAAGDNVDLDDGWIPGDHPRGCWCGHDRDCERCRNRPETPDSSGALEEGR